MLKKDKIGIPKYFGEIPNQEARKILSLLLPLYCSEYNGTNYQCQKIKLEINPMDYRPMILRGLMKIEDTAASRDQTTEAAVALKVR